MANIEKIMKADNAFTWASEKLSVNDNDAHRIGGERYLRNIHKIHRELTEHDVKSLFYEKPRKEKVRIIRLVYYFNWTYILDEVELTPIDITYTKTFRKRKTLYLHTHKNDFLLTNKIELGSYIFITWKVDGSLKLTKD